MMSRAFDDPCPRIPSRTGVRGFAMVRRLLWAAAFTAGLVGAAAAAPGGEAAVAASAWWHGLGVRDLQGRPLDPPARWFVVVFIGPECPVSNASIPVLNRLNTEFAPHGVALVGAYVDPTSDLAALRTHAVDYAITFYTADDRAHRLARAAGATYTPEVVVFSADGEKLYQGRIDDRVGALGATRPAAVHHELRDVLAALLAGQSGPFSGHAGYGCAIPRSVQP